MKSEQTPTGLEPEVKKPLWQRIGWLVLIWIASVASLAVAAGLLRLLMAAAGMKSH